MQQRKYFGTDGIRGRVGESLINPEFVLKLGWAVGRVLANGERSKVLIGKDTRISGYLLESALEAGLSAAGVDIKLLGPMPTPAIAYLTRTLGAKAGIVISASHNVYHDNGIKFFSAEGLKLPDSLEQQIEAYIDTPLTTVDSQHLGRASRLVDAPGRYIEFCKSTVPAKTRFNGLKIVVDCANGAAYHIAPAVFRELGAEVIELAVEPDGFNINADCGSTKPTTLQKAVCKHHADVGIALDGDADRVVLIDAKGELLEGDELLYIIAKDRLRTGYLQGGVVGTVMSNLGLEIALNAMGIEFVRSKVGDRYVMSALRERGWQLGGEASGHIVCLDKTTTGDGIISALQVLHAVFTQDITLHEAKAGFQKFPQTLLNVPVDNPQHVMNAPDVQNTLRQVEADLADQGRILLRPSGTEPVIRVMVEGRDPTQVATAAELLANAVRAVC